MPSRNYNIDLLKLFSMYGIVFIHSINFGGVIDVCGSITTQGVLSTMLYSFFYAMTNVFVIITAWFLPYSTFAWRKLRKLFFTTSGYSLLIYGLLCAFGQVSFTPIKFVTCALSLFTNQYWFVTAYAILYVVSPYLNTLLERLEEHSMQRLCNTLLFIFSVVPTCLFFVPGQTLADVSNGQGFAWFIVIYCVVFYLRKFRCENLENIPMHRYAMAILVCVALLACSKYVMTFISIKIGMGGAGSQRFYFNSSIPVALISICTFMMAWKNHSVTRYTKCISTAAATTLGIYIIHTQPQLNMLLWTEVNKLLLRSHDMALIINIGITFGVFIVSMTIEWIRTKVSTFVTHNHKTAQL